MIKPIIWAGLGNQCFQVAAAIAHAKRMGVDYALPSATLNPKIWKKYFEWLPISDEPTKNSHSEPIHSFLPIPHLDDLTIKGYFQSEFYFEDAKSEVRQALRFPDAPVQQVAIHVRRGDYLLYPDLFPVLSTKYYTTAVMEMMSRGYSKFKIYSDDIPWCRKFFTVPYFAGTDITFSTEKDPLLDLYSMYNSIGFIIANSSYSLFAAILNGTDNVIAPAEERWYGKKAILDTLTLMPERWTKI